MKLRLPSILADENELDQPPQPAELEPEPAPLPLHWTWTAAIAVLAGVPRLLYLFVFSDPENPGDGIYTDVWHHWQIAYLTKEIGLTAPDGPRLWDLKGLDYFWGILHPVLMLIVFGVTQSIDIALDRVVSIAFGVVAVVFLFDICRAYWGTQVAVAVALVASLLPTSVLNDASGMLEPLGTALCLAGIWAWTRRRGAWSGIAFGAASMARAEAWLFGAGMVVAALAGRVRAGQKAPLVAGFASVIGLYMLVLLNKTGNPIYPLWWNFLANALGKWEVAVTPYQASVRPVLGVLLVVALAGLGWALVRRPPSYMLLTFGFGSWAFVTGLVGFTSYLADWSWWTPIGRHFEFPYEFVAVLICAFCIWWLPKRFAVPTAAGWTVVVAGLLAAQLLWIPIGNAFGPTESTWRATMADGVALAVWYGEAPYAGHALAVPPDRPDITYVLARYGNVEGKHLVSEMYDPFAYLPAGYTYQDHRQVVDTLVACWLGGKDIRLLAASDDNASYQVLIQDKPGWFTSLGRLDAARWTVFGVTAPQLSATECQAATSSVR